jgi:hypothetical protein
VAVFNGCAFQFGKHNNTQHFFINISLTTLTDKYYWELSISKAALRASFLKSQTIRKAALRASFLNMSNNIDGLVLQA